MRKFKTESQKILDIMINSIYTNKDIFLRELVSNASDAMDKLYYQSLDNGVSGLNREALTITILADKGARTLTISDNGIGMTADEMDQNLGIIAKSGSQEFRESLKNAEDSNTSMVDIIGKFGVGFYSAFMVAERVRVASKRYGTEEAHAWLSNGVEGYDIKPTSKDGHGTDITLYLKANTEEEDYDQYLEEYTIKRIVKAYSDFIRYPIRTMVTVYGTEGEEPKQEMQTINSMTPLWVKSKSEITEEEYASFYKASEHDSDAPLLTIHTRVEGKVDYKALLFVPARAPYDYYSKSYEKGLKLYTSGVLIADKEANLLPDHFSFVKGLVDCDLPLNISRETIQKNHQLKAIADNLEKKIAKELLSLLESDRDKYKEFYKAFGIQLRYGIYSDWGMHKDLLQDLILVSSLTHEDGITFKEYVAEMKEGQNEIYYGIGASVDAVRHMPQVSSLVDKGYDVLCFSGDIDEFALKMMREYDGKAFVSIATVPTEEVTDQNDTLVSFVQGVLAGRIKECKLTNRLKEYAACLTTTGDLTLEMERILNAMPGGGGAKAERVLELNATHPSVTKLTDLIGTNEAEATQLVQVLYDLACLSAGVDVDNVAEMVARITAYIK